MPEHYEAEPPKHFFPVPSFDTLDIDGNGAAPILVTSYVDGGKVQRIVGIVPDAKALGPLAERPPVVSVIILDGGDVIKSPEHTGKLLALWSEANKASRTFNGGK